jgi:hypothetical protein
MGTHIILLPAGVSMTHILSRFRIRTRLSDSIKPTT